jgi:hypothetical protein
VHQYAEKIKEPENGRKDVPRQGSATATSHRLFCSNSLAYTVVQVCLRAQFNFTISISKLRSHSTYLRYTLTKSTTTLAARSGQQLSLPKSTILGETQLSLSTCSPGVLAERIHCPTSARPVQDFEMPRIPTIVRLACHLQEACRKHTTRSEV